MQNYPAIPRNVADFSQKIGICETRKWTKSDHVIHMRTTCTPRPSTSLHLTKRADEKYDHTWVRETLAFWSRLIKRRVWDIHIHVSYSHFDRNWPKGESPGSNKQPCSPPTLSFLVEAGVIITILCFSFLYVANTSDWVSRVGKIKRLRLCKI